jgi:hypothetical protein
MSNDKEDSCDVVTSKDKTLVVQAKETNDKFYSLRVQQDAIRDHSARPMIIR